MAAVASSDGRAAAFRTAWPGAVAFVSACLVLASFARFGLSGAALVGAVLSPALVLLSAIDLERHVLPNRIVLPAAAIVLVLHIALAPSHAAEWVIAAIAAALALLLLLLVYPPGLGMGDVKLALLLGAALGTAVVGALVVGFLLSAVAAVALLLSRGVAARKRMIPLGPFLAFGALVLYFVSS